MIKKLLPVVMILAGLGGGIGAGLAMKAPIPETTDLANPCGDVAGDRDMAKPMVAEKPESAETTDFLKMPNQFVVPVVKGDRVGALVVMSLTLEIDPIQQEAIFNRLPKLRDGFLRAILDHANTGGFDGRFTSNGSMDSLRRAFVEIGQGEFSSGIHDVLILDINRQDLD